VGGWKCQEKNKYVHALSLAGVGVSPDWVQKQCFKLAGGLAYMSRLGTLRS